MASAIKSFPIKNLLLAQVSYILAAKPFFMQLTLASAAVAAGLFLLVISAGCTSPTDSVMKGFGTPTETPSPEQTTPATLATTPVAVATLPPEQYVDISVTKERPDATIHVLYNGGKGEMFVQSIMVRVTLADGEVIEQYMNDNARKPRRGDEIVIQGTRSGSDRVQVYLTTAGQTYQVYGHPVVSMPI